MLILNDLHRIVPSMNFEPSFIDRLRNKKLGHEGGDSNGKEFDTQLTLTLCSGQQDDLINPLIKTPWMTTEKLLNTDEQCAFQTGEHLPPLTDIELQEELSQYCTKFQWDDIQNILGKAFHVSITSHPSDHTVYHYLFSHVNQIDIYHCRHLLVIHHYLQNCIKHRYLIKNSHH